MVFISNCRLKYNWIDKKSFCQTELCIATFVVAMQICYSFSKVVVGSASIEHVLCTVCFCFSIYRKLFIWNRLVSHFKFLPDWAHIITCLECLHFNPFESNTPPSNYWLRNLVSYSKLVSSMIEYEQILWMWVMILLFKVTFLFFNASRCKKFRI